MAEMSEIMDNYKDMSVSELGSSLLQRKEERAKEARRSSRKQQKIEQALGLLLAGQAVFKTAYKKREKELNDSLAFELTNNDYQSKEINQLSQIVSTMPTDFGDAKTTDEKTDAFFNSNNFSAFKQAVQPLIDVKMKQGFKGTDADFLSFQQSAGYDNSVDSAAKEYAREFIKDDNYKTFESELRSLLQAGDMDRVELFKQGIGLTPHRLTQAEKRNYALIVSEYRKKGNLFGGFKEVLTRIGLRDKEKTNARAVELGLSPDYDFNPFGKIDENTLSGPRMTQLIDSINLKGMTNRITDKAALLENKSDISWRELARLDSNEPLRNNIKDVALKQLRNDINTGNRPIEGKPFNNISRNMFEESIDDLAQNEDFIVDITAISLRLKQDRAFIEGIWNQTDKTMTLQEFEKEVRGNPTFRNKVSATLVISEGAVDKPVVGDIGDISTLGQAVRRGIGKLGTSLVTGGFSPALYPEYKEEGTLQRIYDRASGIIPNLIGEGIIPPQKEGQNYSATETYTKASQSMKEDIFDAELNRILKKYSDNPMMTEVMINNLFNNVKPPLDLNVEEYLRRMAEKQQKKTAFVETELLNPFRV
jgi:hypothetical protein